MIEVGKWNTLKVIRSKDFGIYLGEDGNAGETVLLPRKQVPEKIKAGATMDVFVYRDSQDRPIATTNVPYITLGGIKRLRVRNVTEIGAFMDWGLEKDIFLPFKEQTAKVEEGREYLVRMYADKSDRLCVTMKLYKYLKPITGYEKGQSFKGIVYEYKKGLGAFVAIDDIYPGLIHESELYSKVCPGDEVEGRILDIRDDGKANVTLRNPAYKQMEEDSDMVYDVIKSYQGVLPFTDKADKEIIKREFGLSKNAFKRAVGRLLKEKKIKITEKTIEITNQSGNK
ncbi:MAG: S1-like domain-containing RNA-binding protein [Clostridium sp.]|nr:S1-like domain-containing RNA-binding protein [Clostridium sp.]MCM1398557.1 S1-like domain-containing RNA-binding protein [Clostridium sp.]MCM1459845.1 S1-like domain-containing RNA-binding protein [Bacteroides sp.]